MPPRGPSVAQNLIQWWTGRYLIEGYLARPFGPRTMHVDIGKDLSKRESMLSCQSFALSHALKWRVCSCFENERIPPSFSRVGEYTAVTNGRLMGRRGKDHEWHLDN